MTARIRIVIYCDPWGKILCCIAMAFTRKMEVSHGVTTCHNSRFVVGGI